MSVSVVVCLHIMSKLKTVYTLRPLVLG